MYASDFDSVSVKIWFLYCNLLAGIDLGAEVFLTSANGEIKC